jgi:Spy/CpxP family protein refolding chaperone
MNGLSKWKLALYLVALFAAGGVSGWLVAAKMARERAFAPPRFDEYASRMRTQLHEKLELTSEQKEKLDTIFERNSKEMNAVHGELMKRIRQGMSNRTVLINAILTPEQQKKFEALEKERMEQWRRKGRDGGRDGKDPREGGRDSREGPRDGRRGSGPRGGTNPPANVSSEVGATNAGLR